MDPEPSPARSVVSASEAPPQTTGFSGRDRAGGFARGALNKPTRADMTASPRIDRRADLTES